MSFKCDPCNFATNDRKDFRIHTATSKHARNTGNKQQKEPIHQCEQCGKKYISPSGLYRHRQKCSTPMGSGFSQYISPESKIDMLTEMVMTLTKIVEKQQQTPNVTNNTFNGGENVVVNNNNTVLMMLNTDHTHVISMDNFIKNMYVPLARTISAINNNIPQITKDIFLDNMAGIPPEDRPIHCSDAKRDSYYVKGPEEWYKDHGEKLNKAFQKIFNLHVHNLTVWTNSHPGWKDDPKLTEEFVRMQNNIMGPESEEEQEYINSQARKLINMHIPVNDIKDN